MFAARWRHGGDGNSRRAERREADRYMRLMRSDNGSERDAAMKMRDTAATPVMMRRVYRRQRR